MKQYCVQADVVITTAQLFGRKAPLIVTKDMVAGMKPGSVLVDLAVESGGNVEGSAAGKTVEMNGVKIIGVKNMPARVAMNASLMYSNNLYNLLDEFWNNDKKQFELKTDDEIIQGCLITHDGKIVHPTFVSATK